MKRLIKTVKLSFFQDDANGEFGLCHKDTQDDRFGRAFNAFWDGMGLFHDVFEHSHEHTNKYFRGDYAMNIGGEMAAMGSLWYYVDVLGVYNRLRSGSMYAPSESMMQTTLSDVQECITEGYTSYGNTLESNVPYQRPTDNGELEYVISEYWNKVKETNVRTEYEQEKEAGIEYKKSVTFRKIADLHRYGFRMAAKLVPDSWDNRQVLANFIEYWNEFCKNNNAEEMNNAFDGLTVKLYKDQTGLITWKAVLTSRDRFAYRDVTITEATRFSMEDAWIIEDEN